MTTDDTLCTALFQSLCNQHPNLPPKCLACKSLHYRTRYGCTVFRDAIQAWDNPNGCLVWRNDPTVRMFGVDSE